MDCVFCKIIKKEIPAYIVYEDEKVIAFLDIAPVNPGHTLIVPKIHYENILDTPSKILEELILATKKIAKAVCDGIGYAGFNLGVNNGRVAGQIISHLHFHIIPRRINDGLRLWPQRRYTKGEPEKVVQKIKEKIK